MNPVHGAFDELHVDRVQQRQQRHGHLLGMGFMQAGTHVQLGLGRHQRDLDHGVRAALHIDDARRAECGPDAGEAAAHNQNPLFHGRFLFVSARGTAGHRSDGISTGGQGTAAVRGHGGGAAWLPSCLG
ncbi:hypothetical protein D3C86_1863480 [compost metagenome]